MRVHGIVVAALAGVCFAMRAGAQHPDFTGVWKMDTTKFAKRDAELSALTLTVSKKADTLLVVTDVVDTGRPPMQMRARYLPLLVTKDEKSATPLHSSVSSWAGDTLVLRSVEERPQRTLKIEERWMLDESGLTLSRLQTVYDGTRRSQQTLIFTRQ
jgi:hypothetical protein